MVLLRINGIRSDNKTGVTGVHKFIYAPRKFGVKKRFNRPDKWTVQFRTRHVCICTDFVVAVIRRLEEEIKGKMFPDISKSSAYTYLKHNNLLEGIV